MSQDEEPMGGNIRCLLSFLGRWTDKDEAYYQKINSPNAIEERIIALTRL